MAKNDDQPSDLDDDSHLQLWQNRVVGGQEPEVEGARANRKKARKRLSRKQSESGKTKAEIVAKVTEAAESFAEIPTIKRLSNEDHEHRRKFAAKLQKPFNDYLHSLPQDTYAEKRVVSILANLLLRKFGLALRCPKTGRASILVADLGNHPETGRYQFVNQDDEGRTVRPVSTPLLPEALELVPEDLSRSVKTQGGTWLDRLQRTTLETSPADRPR